MKVALQGDVLPRGALVVNDGAAKAIVRNPQPVALGLRVREPADPVVGVLEGARDPLGADLEGFEHGGARALHPVERPAAGLAEVGRDQYEGDEQECAQHDAAPKGAAGAGGIRGGSLSR